jgi:ribonuclease HII
MSLFAYDQSVREEGYPILCGVDEAGRGPLAGPVYAAAVILPPQVDLPQLRDSKKLTPKKRDQLFDQIREIATAWCIADASVEEIEALNILQAAMLAMKRAVEGLAVPPDLVLVDGNQLPGTGTKERLVVGGDDTSACIAAASILAKVARDRKMLELDTAYPGYEFGKHKGYPTKLHYQKLKELGSCPVHRESFLRKWRRKQSEAT